MCHASLLYYLLQDQNVPTLRNYTKATPKLQNAPECTSLNNNLVWPYNTADFESLVGLWALNE